MFTEKEREEQIIKMVKERMPDVGVSPAEICKNNGCCRRGIQIFGKENPKGVIVYWDSITASCTGEEAADHICQAAERELPVRIDRESILNWEKAKHMVYSKAVNYERNADRLCSMVHRRYLDLAEVYYLRIPVNGKEFGTGEIYVRMLEKWGISEAELSKQAEINMNADGYHMQSMDEYLRSAFSEEGPLLPDFPDSGLYLIRNRTGEFGAGVMTSRKHMKEFMEQAGEDCYILPSSVHELLALPSSLKSDMVDLHLLVQGVNLDAVLPEEFLSDNVYFCHMDTGEVELCCDM